MAIAGLWRIWLASSLVAVCIGLVCWVLVVPPLIDYVPPVLGRFIIGNWFLALLIAPTVLYAIGLLLIAFDRGYSLQFRLLWVVTGVCSWSIIPILPFAYWVCFVRRSHLFQARPST